MNRLSLLLCCGLSIASAIAAKGECQEPASEVSLSDKEIGRLDIFEDRSLSEADAFFNLQKYAEARGKYEAFLTKHTNSPATAYAMLRKGRCAELNGQSVEAIADYESLAKRFPKSVKYAAASLFYLAELQRKNGNPEEAAKVKARLMENKDYADSPFATEAVVLVASSDANQLSSGNNSPTVQKLTLEQYEQIALAGADSNDEGAAEAIVKVVRQHVRTAPDEAKLRTFYKRLRKDAGDHPEKTLAYWLWVNDGIQVNSSFSYSERTQREQFFQHWLGLMKDKFPDSDDIQIAIAKLHYGIERDRNKFAERLDALFKKKQHAAGATDPRATKLDWRRTLKWVRAYKGNYTKTREYVAMFNYETADEKGTHALVTQLYNEQNERYLARSVLQKITKTLSYDTLTNEQIRDLIALAHGTVKDISTAQMLAGKLKFKKMSEQEKLTLAREFLAVDGSVARQVYNQLDDQAVGKLELFEHYVTIDNLSAAIVLAGELAELDGYAKEYTLKKAEMLEAADRHSEAIAAFQECDNSAAILWRIVDCHVALGDTEKAVEQLSSIEKTYKNQSAKAALRIAALYGEAEDKEKQIAALRAVVKKYPNSKEAKEADNGLGDLGVPPSLPTDTVFEF